MVRHMEYLFDKYSTWKLLRFFALNPSSEVYVNEIAKKIDISTGMCSNILRELETFGLLNKKVMGLAHYYKLSDNFLTNELKRFIGLFQIYEAGLVAKLKENNPSITSIALYGSYAKGDFIEGSDIDVLLITPDAIKPDINELESILDTNINIEAFSLGQWLKMKEKNEGFYKAVINNHILLDGGVLS